MKDCTLSEASRICNRISDCRNCPFVDKEYVKCALVGMGTPATWQVDGWQVGVGNKVIKDERIKYEQDMLKKFVEYLDKYTARRYRIDYDILLENFIREREI